MPSTILQIDEWAIPSNLQLTLFTKRKKNIYKRTHLMPAAKNGIDRRFQPSYCTPDHQIRAEHEILTIVRRRRLHDDMLTYK